MSETLLDLVSTALNELMIGNAQPTSVIGNSDEFVLGMLSMATASGRDLVRRYEWGNLITLATFPTVANQSDYPLPADFYRMINDTQWDTSNNWPMVGPLTPQAEQYLRDSQIAQSNIYRQFRQIGNRSIRITPIPADASGVIVYEYLSRNWVVSGSTTASAFAADTDTCIFDFDLMVKTMKWRWRSAKGYDATEFKAEADEALMAIIAADQGGTVLNMSGADDDDGGYAFAGTPNYAITGPINDPWATGYGWNGANTVGAGTTSPGGTTTTGGGTTTPPATTAVPVEATPPFIVDNSVAPPVETAPPTITG